MILALALAFTAATPRPPVPAGVAWVRAENDGAGAGFVIDAERKLFVTCRHVVADPGEDHIDRLPVRLPRRPRATA